MRLKLLAFVTLLIGSLAPLPVFAQAAPPAAAQGGGRGPAPVKQNIDVAVAKKMVAAAEAAAMAANANIAISVVDANGDLVYFERMNGASPRAVTSCEGKARAALLFGMPTKDVQAAAAAHAPVSATITVPAAGAFELTPAQGGLPIIVDGKVVGAVGCGGSLPANDEKFCQAGLDAGK